MSLRNVSAGHAVDETAPVEKILHFKLVVQDTSFAAGNELRSIFDVGPVTAVWGLRHWIRQSSPFPAGVVWTSYPTNWLKVATPDVVAVSLEAFAIEKVLALLLTPVMTAFVTFRDELTDTPPTRAEIPEIVTL